jgi:hypothetical protein
MARIVYGLSGEGSGHFSRAAVVLPAWQRMGQAVRVATCVRGWRKLKEQFDVSGLEALGLAPEGNAVSAARSVTDNSKRLWRGHKPLQAAARRMEAR